MKYICFHGFLGHPEDFGFLQDQIDYISLDVGEYIYLSAEEICKKILSLYPDSKIGLIGYSFGARMALKVFLSDPSAFSSLSLLAGHAGIKDHVAVNKREQVELKFIKKIEDLDQDDFQDYWNGLELFKYDQQVTLPEINKTIAIDFFQLWGLSKQGYLRDKLVPYSKSVKWYFGSKDLKYSNYAKKELLSFNVCYLNGLGHRIIKSKIMQDKLIEDLKCLK